MYGAQRVAEQDHVLIAPALVHNHSEVDPHRFVGEKRVPCKVLCEDALAVVDALLLRHVRESSSLPRTGIAFHDERAGICAIGVAVGHKGAALVFPEDQRERLEELVSPIPDIFVREQAGCRLKLSGVLLPHYAAHAIGPDNYIAVVEARGIRQTRREVHLDPMLPAVCLQDAQQGQPRDTRVAAAIDFYGLALVNNGLVIPGFEGCLNVGVGLGIALFEEGECAVREDDAPAIGGVRRVLFDDGDLVGWVELLHEQGEIQACWAAANDADLHWISPSHFMSLRVSLYLFSSPKWIECLSFTWGFWLLGLLVQSKRITARTIGELDTCIHVGRLIHEQVKQGDSKFWIGISWHPIPPSSEFFDQLERFFDIPRTLIKRASMGIQGEDIADVLLHSTALSILSPSQVLKA